MGLGKMLLKFVVENKMNVAVWSSGIELKKTESSRFISQVAKHVLTSAYCIFRQDGDPTALISLRYAEWRT